MKKEQFTHYKNSKMVMYRCVKCRHIYTLQKDFVDKKLITKLRGVQPRMIIGTKNIGICLGECKEIKDELW